MYYPIHKVTYNNKTLFDWQHFTDIVISVMRRVQWNSWDAVSYTHLDVYKRQGLYDLYGIVQYELYGRVRTFTSWMFKMKYRNEKKLSDSIIQKSNWILWISELHVSTVTAFSIELSQTHFSVETLEPATSFINSRAFAKHVLISTFC